MRMEMRWEQLTLPASIFLSFSASSVQPHPTVSLRENPCTFPVCPPSTLFPTTSRSSRSLSLFLAVPLACGMLIL